MQQRKLGRRGLEVSAIGFSGMGAGTDAGGNPGRATLSRQQHIAVIRAAHDFGVTLFDPAGAHSLNTGQDRLEEVMGEAIAPFRHKVAIVTTVATTLGTTAREQNLDRSRSGPAHVRASAEASLKRLNVDAIDLLYLRSADATVQPSFDAPIEDLAGAVHDLMRQGKVKHFGLCGASAATLHRAHAVQPVSVLRSAYSLLTRDVERNGVLQAVEELGIGFAASSPLVGGLLAGRGSTHDTAVHDVMLSKLKDLAMRKHATPAQLALAWLLAQKPWIVPMPTTHRIGHLDENLGGADVGLDMADLHALDAALLPLTEA